MVVQSHVTHERLLQIFTAGTVRCAAVVAGLSLAFNVLALAPGELPSGGQLSAGQARIQAVGTTMTVHQDTATPQINQ